MARHVNRRPKRPLPPEQAKERKHDPLLRWQARFALWYATQARQPTMADQVAAATAIAGAPITYEMLKRAKMRKDWRELYDASARGGIEAAAKVLETNLALAMEARVWAIEHARAANDHRAVGPLTDALVERAWPKKEGPLVAQQIILTLSPRQAALLSYERPTLQVEALPPLPGPDAPAPDMPLQDARPDQPLSWHEAMAVRKAHEAQAGPRDSSLDDFGTRSD